MIIKKLLDGQHLLSQSLASIIDQFLLSGLNFGIGILLIRLATKEEYGAYTQLFAAGLLAATLLEAFLGTTLTTLVARKESKEQSKMIVAARKLQHRLSIGMALFFGIGGAAFLHNLKEENIIVVEIGLAFGLYIFTLTQREFQRTLYFLKHKATDVLKLDFAFVVYSIMGGGLLWHLNLLNLPAIFILLALANILSDLHALKEYPLMTEDNYTIKSILIEIWPLAKWALPGALLGWIGNYSYLYLSSIFLSLSASADLNAGRLLLVPIALVVVAWSRVVRPKAGHLIATRNWKKLNQLSLYSLLGLEAITITYALFLVFTFEWLSAHLLGPKYTNIGTILELWCLYFAVNAARYISTTWLACYGAYSAMFWTSLTLLLLQIALCFYTMPRYEAPGVIVASVIVEIISLFVFWGIILPKVKKNELLKIEVQS